MQEPPVDASALLRWYDKSRRALPWRAEPGDRTDPYRVWLSEIMLQQTTVATVTPRFGRFLERWPTIEDLAAASLDDVLHEWQGLGYYARARNLHRCAQVVANERDGVFPSEEAALRQLPGIGPYTAAAIAAIAFDARATGVDGNVERVMARLHGVETPLPKAKKELAALARSMTPETRPGDFAQALMDLGATVCTPRRPHCASCPWRSGCSAYAAGSAALLPRRERKPARPTRYGVAFWLQDVDGRVLIRRRPEEGLLGGLYEIPSTAWRGAHWDDQEALEAAPTDADWHVLHGEVVHVFTHFRLVLRVAKGVPKDCSPDGVWVHPSDFADYALPSVMKKVVRWAMDS